MDSTTGVGSATGAGSATGEGSATGADSAAGADSATGADSAAGAGSATGASNFVPQLEQNIALSSIAEPQVLHNLDIINSFRQFKYLFFAIFIIAHRFAFVKYIIFRLMAHVRPCKVVRLVYEVSSDFSLCQKFFHFLVNKSSIFFTFFL